LFIGRPGYIKKACLPLIDPGEADTEDLLQRTRKMEPKAISILVIDGDSTSRNYLADALGKSGFSIVSAPLGREGLIAAWRDRPRVIILDSVLPDLTGLELVTRLRRDRRTSRVLLVALSSQEKSQERAALLTAGCNEYLVKSSQTLKELQELLSDFANGRKKAPKAQGKLIAFLSAKGGVGTSSLCVNIAMTLASEKADKKVAVVDLVLPIGSIAYIVGYNGRLNLVTAAMQGTDQTTPAYFREHLPLISGWHFHLLAGAPDPESADRLPFQRVNDILKAIMESYDFVFVDLGRSLSRISLPIIQKADVIASILSTDLASAYLTTMVWEYLKAKGVDRQRNYSIQNRAVGLEGLSKTEIEKMTGMPIHVTIPYLGGDFSLANNRHEPLSARLQSPAVTILLKQVATQIAEMEQRQKRTTP
jgi:pilus assembly protein CpaE